MENNKFNINKPFNAGDYTPDIPADEAWKGMHEILDRQMPVSLPRKGQDKSGFAFRRIFLIVFLSVCLLFSWIFIRNKSSHAPLSAFDNKTESTTTDTKTSLPVENKPEQTLVNDLNITNQAVISQTPSQNLNFDPTASAIQQPDILSGISHHKNQQAIENTKGHDVKSSSVSSNYPGQLEVIKIPDKEQVIINDRKNDYANRIVPPLAVTKIIADLQSAKSSLARAENRNKDDGKKTAKKNNSKTIPNGFHFGLEWSTPIPLQPNRGSYFVGGNGKNEPYMTLIPGVWISKTFGGRHEITVQFKPYQQYFPGNKAFASILDITQPTQHTRTYYLLKTTGKTANFDYSYFINKKWAVSVGMGIIGQRRAYINETFVNDVNNSVELDTTYSIYHNFIDTVPIKKPSFVTGKAGLFYNISNKVQIGAAVTIPLSTLSAFPGTSIRPTNGQLFIRWRIK